MCGIGQKEQTQGFVLLHILLNLHCDLVGIVLKSGGFARLFGIAHMHAKGRAALYITGCESVDTGLYIGAQFEIFAIEARENLMGVAAVQPMIAGEPGR